MFSLSVHACFPLDLSRVESLEKSNSALHWGSCFKFSSLPIIQNWEGVLKNVVFIITLFITAMQLSAQVIAPQTWYYYPLGTFTKIGAASWAAGGARIANPLDATAGFSNPALKNSYQQMLYAEFGKRFETENALEEQIKLDNQNFIPAFAALNTSAFNFNFSAGYAHYSSDHLSFTATLPSLDFPEGETYTFKRALEVHQFYLAVRQEIASKLAVGINAGLNHGKLRAELYETTSREGDGHGYHFTAGVVYSPSDRIKISGTYRTDTDIKLSFSFNEQESFLTRDSLGGPFQVQIIEEKHIAVFPQIFSFGAGVAISKNWQYTLQFDIEKWASLDDAYENTVQLYTGISHSILKDVAIMAGYFTQSSPAKTIGNYYDQKFLTGGLNFKLPWKCKLSLAIIDSHLFNNKQPDEKKDLFKQTYISAGFAFDL